MKTVSLEDINLNSKSAIKNHFRIPLFELIDGSQIFLPCALIGKGGGKVVTVMAGQHGNEWTGTYACNMLYKNLDPNDFNGTLVILPVANPLAFRQKRRVSNVDFVDMNRVFRFIKAHKPTDKIAKIIFNDFCLKSDLVIDLHGGGPGEYVPIVEITDDNDIDLGLSLNLGNLIVLIKDSGAVVTNCVRKGIKSLSIEAGRELDIKESNAILLTDGIVNLLSFFEVLKRKTSTKEEQDIFNLKFVVPSPKTGFFTADLELGQIVKKEQPIGRVQPFFSAKPYIVRSPVAGKVIYLRFQRIISEGESIAHVAKFK